MSTDEREQSLRAIAFLAEKIRRDTTGKPWNYYGILGALQRGIPTEKTVAEVARAALWFAQHRTTQDTPLMLSEDGRHWHLDDDEQRGPYLPKPKCLTEPMGDPLPVERIREIRMKAQASQARDEGNPA